MKHKPKTKSAETVETNDTSSSAGKQKMVLPIIPLTGKEKYPSQSPGMLGSAKNVR
jgi:hypothetical protein